MPVCTGTAAAIRGTIHNLQVRRTPSLCVLLLCKCVLSRSMKHRGTRGTRVFCLAASRRVLRLFANYSQGVPIIIEVSRGKTKIMQAAAAGQGTRVARFHARTCVYVYVYRSRTKITGESMRSAVLSIFSFSSYVSRYFS